MFKPERFCISQYKDRRIYGIMWQTIFPFFNWGVSGWYFATNFSRKSETVMKGKYHRIIWQHNLNSHWTKVLRTFKYLTRYVIWAWHENQSENIPLTVRKNTLKVIWDTCIKMAYGIRTMTQYCKSYITTFHTFLVFICLPFEKIIQWVKGRKILNPYKFHAGIWSVEEKHL